MQVPLACARYCDIFLLSLSCILFALLNFKKCLCTPVITFSSRFPRLLLLRGGEAVPLQVGFSNLAALGRVYRTLSSSKLEAACVAPARGSTLFGMGPIAEEDETKLRDF